MNDKAVYIEPFSSPKTGQIAVLGYGEWSVARLIELSKDLEVFDIPLMHMNIALNYNEMSLRNMVAHIDAVNRADMSLPIILDEDGEILDGRHRVMKALLLKIETIKAVRFKENPRVCRPTNKG